MQLIPEALARAHMDERMREAGRRASRRAPGRRPPHAAARRARLAARPPRAGHGRHALDELNDSLPGGTGPNGPVPPVRRGRLPTPDGDIVWRWTSRLPTPPRRDPRPSPSSARAAAPGPRRRPAHLDLLRGERRPDSTSASTARAPTSGRSKAGSTPSWWCARSPGGRGAASADSAANPGSQASSSSRSRTVAPSWHSTPMVLSVTRWISRYDGGRLSCLPNWCAGERGSAIRAACAAQPRPGEGELLGLGRLDDRLQVVQHRVRVQIDGLLDEALGAQRARRPPRRRRPASSAATVPIGIGQPLGQPVDGAEVQHAQPPVRPVRRR